MDLSTDSSTLSTSNIVGGLALERELCLSGDRCQTLSEATILLQLVEFKSHLLEVVGELHIRRDAETRFEDQISKLVLEKQELEWEKESLQHQTETVAKQHTESLINVKKHFQAKIKSLEEEKGKYQVSAEVKDKEINNLKEELKSLQLLKYNLEKKTSELEQKLALKSRSKDCHLKQLGEVEKCFSALSRQCALVKRAHEKLEQNVDEAIKRNEKLTSANTNQEATIVSLKKELEDISNNLIKAKMSSFRKDESLSPTDIDLRFQQLQQRLNKETKINEILMEENAAARAEKQEVMRSLQYAQQLLLSQTQTISRVELDLQTQEEQYQALKQEHEVMRDRSKAAEDKLAQLMESYAASRTSWDKEKAMLLDRIKTEQQELKGVTEAYDALDQKHTELSSQANVQAQLICELEKRDSSQGCHVCAKPLPSSKEEIQGEETLNESMSSSETSSFVSLQDSTQTKKPDHQNDTRAGTLPAVSGATGGQDVQVLQMHKCQQSQNEQPPGISDQLTCTPTNNKNESEPDVFPLLTHASVSNTRDIFSESSTGHTSIIKPLDSIQKKNNDVGRTEGWADDVTPGKQNTEEQNDNEARQWSEEEIQAEDAKKGHSTGETRGTLVAQTTDRADRSEDSQRSTEDAEDTKQPERETEDRAEGAGSDGVEERRKTEPYILEPQIRTQTTADTIAESSDTQQVVDFVDTQPTLAACAPSDYTQSPSDTSHLNRGFQTRREARTSCSGKHQSASHETNFGIEEVQWLSPHNVQKHAQDLNLEKMLEMTDKPIASISSECVILQNQSSIYSLKISAAELSSETGQTQPTSSSDITSIMKQRHEIYETHVKKDGLLLESAFELQALPQSLRISGQEHCDHNGNSQTSEKREAQSNLGKCNNAACEPAQGAEGKSDVVDVSVDNRSDTTEFKTNVEMGKEQNYRVEIKDEAKKTKSDEDLQPPACSSQQMNVAPRISSTKCDEETPAKKIQLDDNNKTFLPSSMAYRSAFDWCSVQRKAISFRTKSDVFSLHQFVQGSLLPEQNTSGPAGLHRQASSTIPMFLKSKRNKVPLVISRASELLNASSVSGSADFSRRHRERGDSKGTTEAATGDTDRRDALSISSFPVSTSSMVISRPPLATSGLTIAPSSAAGQTSDMDLSFSQEQEEQQSSLRAKISEIEQFLSTERFRLPKRPRTDN